MLFQPCGVREIPTHDTRKVSAVCCFLLLAVILVFGQTIHYGFVFDDEAYVIENPVVQKGLTLEGFRWALSFGYIGHWHPLTWLTHMLDVQLYGLQAGGHHLTNVLLHAAAAILLFLVLWRMTGFLWRSAFVAAVFAIHPLRAESVAWVAERKDVLSGLFFMLTLWAYVRYVRRPTSMVRYGAVILLFALGLLSKNTLVTLPFVLLLLDYWPLKRVPDFNSRSWLRLVAEKWPLFALTVASCVITFLVPEEVPFSDRLPFALRMENAVVSYVIYLWQMVYPSGLAVVYPNPTGHLPFWQVAGALGLLLAISGAIFAFRKRYPYLIVGWPWYLGMMVPAIGIVQISYYAHADRYTYLPQIGVYLMLTWLAADISVRWRHRRAVLVGFSAIILFALIYSAHLQVSYWRNDESLWTHTLACTTNNHIAHYNLGNTLKQRGQIDAAIAHYREALEIRPDYVAAHNNLGFALAGIGRIDEAITHYRKALEIRPAYAAAHNNLGMALAGRGQGAEAIAHYREALEIKPDDAKTRNNLGNALAGRGEIDTAIACYRKALEIEPDYAAAHSNLGNALVRRGEVDAAIAHYRRALEIQSDDAAVHYNLGNALAGVGQGDAAIAHYRRALEIKPDYAEAHNNLGISLAGRGQIDAAIVHFQRALEIKPDYAEARDNLGLALKQRKQLDRERSPFSHGSMVRQAHHERDC